MFHFKPLDDHDPLLNTSPLMRALDFLKAEFDENPKGIKLTKSLFLNLKLVERAIVAIDWPDWDVEKIYYRFHKIKVAHEDHFEPLMILHDTLLQLKLVRRYKGHLVLTPLGRTTFQKRFHLFDLIAQTLILQSGFFWHSRSELMGNWNIWLNVIDFEAKHGISGVDLRTVLYGAPELGYDREQSRLYDGVLRPLMWVGLLDEHFDNGRKLTDRIYTHTQLWQKYLQLDDKGPNLRIVN